MVSRPAARLRDLDGGARSARMHNGWPLVALCLRGLVVLQARPWLRPSAERGFPPAATARATGAPPDERSASGQADAVAARRE